MITDTKESSFDIILTHFTEAQIYRNEITGYFESKEDGKIISEQEMNGEFINLKLSNPQSKGLTKQNFDIAINSSFVYSRNPLKSFFESNKSFNETGFIDNLMESIIEVPNKSVDSKKIIKALFTKWLVGCVASIYKTNYNCLMIVLIGKKGCGKTEFFRRLVPDELKDYFAQSKFTDGKDSEALMCEKLIILNDELDGLHVKEARTFRNFISANSYTHRPPYGKQNVTRKRLASVCGASNDKNIIIDAENNRRIIPIEIIKVEHSIYNSVCKKSLFLEAYQLYLKGYNWNLSEEEMQWLDVLSENYEVPVLEYELIQKYYQPNGNLEMTASEIKSDIEARSGQRVSIHKLGSNLKRLGFESQIKRLNGKPSQVYSIHPMY